LIGNLLNLISKLERFLPDILLILVGLISAFVVLLLLNRYIKRNIGDAALAAIVVTIPLIFWGTSGRISEISGLGVTAKFADVARIRINAGDLQIKRVSIIEAPGEGSEHAAMFEVCSPIIAMRSDEKPSDMNERYRNVYVFTKAIAASLNCGKLKGVVVLDSQKRYLGSFEPSFFAESAGLWTLMRPDQSLDKPLDRLEQGKLIAANTTFGTAILYPEVRVKVDGEGFEATIRENASLEEAIEALHLVRRPFLAITDGLGRFKGIVTRDDVLTEILVKSFKN
jgi:CBS domain